MIAMLTGRVVEKTATGAVLDVCGVGYRVAMSTGSLAALPVEGDSVTVFTHLHVREDELSLFGFENAEERSLFEKLITVSGVGPKVALAALSSFAPGVLAEAIAREDAVLVSSIPGVGKKTAQRIILDLRDKLIAVGLKDTHGSVMADDDAAAEARGALMAMGFSSAEIAAALNGYDGPGDAQTLLRHALKRLGGGA
ncbi:MAG: Holliday junction branch migration protein RuvA [Actinomycetota bacterium]|nr:Holliday junction branch migration protein RuvA [Actinomycetota bacterium]